MKSAKSLFGILTITMALVAPVQAQFAYTNNGDGTCTISGYIGAGGAVIIPTNINGLTVTGVGPNAFQNLASLTSVAIPNSVTSIGGAAFFSCTNLTNVTIGTNVTSIGESSFGFCNNLASFTIPDSVTSIGERAFEFCAMTSITIPNGVTNIEELTFFECASLTSVMIGTNVTSMGEEAFSGCHALASVTIPNSVTTIGEYAFDVCTSLTNVSIGNGVTSIGYEAFIYCYSLASVTIGDSVSSIGTNAFYACISLTNVIIPNSVTSIEEGAFASCSNLTSITIPNSVTNIGDEVFANDTSLTSITIPSNVTNIGNEVFESCASLTNVTIPDSVTSIGLSAFGGCTNLLGVYFSGNAPTAGRTAFSSDYNATAYYLLGTTGWSTFSAETGLPIQEWNGTAPVITAQPQSMVVDADNTASFIVIATGVLPLSYQWSLNGTNISGATSSTLTISNAAQTNLGCYAVVVTNVLGTTTSSNATLSMYPFLVAPFGGLVTDWGYTNTLSIQAWGTGPLSYQWFDNGVVVQNATNPTLTLASIQFTNAGLYSVVVTSALGSVTNTPEQVVVEPAGVSLGFSPTVTIRGVTGYTYIIQGSTNLANTNAWVTLTNLTLTQPVQIWVDTNVDASSPFNPQHFYQILPGQ